MERGQSHDKEARIRIQTDGDIVLARQSARELASRLSFSRTELTVLATAVSEIARNIGASRATGRSSSSCSTGRTQAYASWPVIPARGSLTSSKL
jgi:hypothetical protein